MLKLLNLIKWTSAFLVSEEGVTKRDQNYEWKLITSEKHIFPCLSLSLLSILATKTNCDKRSLSMKYHKTTFFERSAGSTKYLKVFTHQSKTFACYDSEAPCFHRVQLIRFSFFEVEKKFKSPYEWRLGAFLRVFCHFNLIKFQIWTKDWSNSNFASTNFT